MNDTRRLEARVEALDRRVISKARFQDYERTLKRRSK